MESFCAVNGKILILGDLLRTLKIFQPECRLQESIRLMINKKKLLIFENTTVFNVMFLSKSDAFIKCIPCLFKEKVKGEHYFISFPLMLEVIFNAYETFNGFHKSDDVCVLISCLMLTIVVTGTKQCS